MKGLVMESPHASSPASDGERIEILSERYRRTRSFTEKLCESLETEDYVIQSMPDVSPTRWHLAHTSWFFETFLLREHLEKYESPDDRYNFLFNSYYNAVGEQYDRPRRGLLSRPTVSEVYDYRRRVDEEMRRIFALPAAESLAGLVEIGIQHEQQHQELMLTDIKHVFSVNPLRPAYREREEQHHHLPHLHRHGHAGRLGWVSFEEGVREVGHDGDGFAYDNELPVHRVFLEPFAISNRLVTNAEFEEFVEDGGYNRPELWLDAGWAIVQERGWKAPLYWERHDGGWRQFTLAGMQPLVPDEPVVHASYYEADAFARWAGRRLPTEFEWEIAATDEPIEGNFVGDGIPHPAPLGTHPGKRRLAQLFGDCWEWTMSHYSPYPGYRPAPGAIGEYNGKWMANQFVLRGGSCATSRDHIRRTYRNFFPGDARWQFTGIRLADEP
jgi:ergothioneine biosynthesis protein EgtB